MSTVSITVPTTSEDYESEESEEEEEHPLTRDELQVRTVAQWHTSTASDSSDHPASGHPASSCPIPPPLDPSHHSSVTAAMLPTYAGEDYARPRQAGGEHQEGGEGEGEQEVR